MERYDHGGDVYSHPGAELDFSVNLNPLGMPDAVREAAMAGVNGCQAYPDPRCRALRRAIAQSEGLDEGEVLPGNGASDLIYRLCLAARPGLTLLTAPTFSEYERAALFSGSKIRYHSLAEGEGFALTRRILQDISPDTGLVFICNPNNPTGLLADSDLMEHVAARCGECGAILAVDECFLPFTEGESCRALLDRYSNIVILDSFTKRYAMAGLRLGYALSKDKALIEAMAQAGPPWSVSTAAQAAGVAALSCAGHVEDARRLVKAERQYLAAILSELGLKVYPGSANYIFFRCGMELAAPLLRRGMLIRSCANYQGLSGGYYRICVMDRERNDRLLSALREVLHG